MSSSPHRARLPARDRIAPQLAALIPLAIATVHLYQIGPQMVDDAYISFRYARNLADGFGLVFNPGEQVEGFSNLLWTLLLTPFARAGFSLPETALFLG